MNKTKKKILRGDGKKIPLTKHLLNRDNHSHPLRHYSTLSVHIYTLFFSAISPLFFSFVFHLSMTVRRADKIIIFFLNSPTKIVTTVVSIYCGALFSSCTSCMACDEFVSFFFFAFFLLLAHLKE